MVDLLLSICIPTYNRAPYLEKCLTAIFSQINDRNRDAIEVFISNNASPDNTTEIVERFIAGGNKISYNINAKNLGIDPNLNICFSAAKGKYVWIFSDDDFILPGYFNKILSFLSERELGVVYLNNLWYYNEHDIVLKPDTVLDYTLFQDPVTFVDRVNYWFTFCTANIINKKLLRDQDWKGKFLDTNLLQLSWTFPAVFKAEQNAFIEDKAIACKAGNTGGYKLYKVFGRNLNLVMDETISAGFADRRIKDIINNHLVNTFFPPFIKDRANKFNNENSLKVLLPVFWKYKSFWSKIVPLYLPKRPTVSRLKSYVIRKLASAFFRVIESGHYKAMVASREQSRIKELTGTFRSFGQNSMLPDSLILKNPQYISIGRNFQSLPNLRIEAWDEYAGQKFTPQIIIGDNVCFNTDIHIGSIDKVFIGNNVMLASRIYISDHSHGDISAKALTLAPALRPLVSKGPVIIENNVWLGEGVCVFPGVTIGKNSIVGANAVVTKNIPPNSIAVGVPAKVIKILE